MQLLFFTNVFFDFALAQDTLTRVRHQYPNSKILVRLDGSDSEEFKYFCRTINAEIFKEKNLYQEGNGGAITQRSFELMLHYHADYYIKIETDTIPINPLNFSLLSNNKITVNFFSDRPSIKNHYTCIYGGVVIHPKKLIKEIFESNLLLDEKYLGFSYFNRTWQKKMACQDRIIADVFKQLKIQCDAREDLIFSRAIPVTPTKTQKINLCFYHPEKDIKRRVPIYGTL